MSGYAPAVMLRRVFAAIGVLDRALEAFEAVLISGAILGMAVTSITNVVARNGFGRSLSSAEEVSQLLSVLVTFGGIGYAARRARHIRMSALYDSLSGRPRKALWILTCLGTGALLLLLAVHAVAYVGSLRLLGSVTPALRVPLHLVYLCVPVGLGLGGVQYVLTALRNVLEPGVHASFRLAEQSEPPLETF
jgi:C4-dicarboxylate transporter DctQ subunit